MAGGDLFLTLSHRDKHRMGPRDAGKTALHQIAATHACNWICEQINLAPMTKVMEMLASPSAPENEDAGMLENRTLPPLNPAASGAHVHVKPCPSAADMQKGAGNVEASLQMALPSFGSLFGSNGEGHI